MRKPLLIVLAVLGVAAAAVAVLLLGGGDGEGAGERARADRQAGPELSVMDDQLLLGASRRDVERAMASFRFQGFDRLRVSAFWRDHAPVPLSERRPRDRPYSWGSLDRVVRAAASHGLKVTITITTPAPWWATAQPSRHNPLLRPRPADFAAFAAAVATRYREQADQYTVLNEPNQGGWLQPQSDGEALEAPHLYRSLVHASYGRIRRADPSAAVLVGELASSGRDERGVTRPIRPLEFLRELACVDDAWRPRGDGPCRGFRPVPLDAYSHHPYQPFSAPDTESAERDDAAIGDTRRLIAAVDRLVAAGRLKPGRDAPLPIQYTEFGYQTDPPDPLSGIPLERQERWLQEAAYVAWRHRDRVRSLNQFRLTDGAVTAASGNARFREFQSGLYFADFGPKPAAYSFPHPLVARGRRLFGQARRANGGAVTLQRAARSGGPWEVAREEVRTDRLGYFELDMTREPAGLYRYAYSFDGRRFHSPVVRLGA